MRQATGNFLSRTQIDEGGKFIGVETSQSSSSKFVRSEKETRGERREERGEIKASQATDLSRNNRTNRHQNNMMCFFSSSNFDRYFVFSYSNLKLSTLITHHSFLN
jgi:hypothetical protein